MNKIIPEMVFHLRENAEWKVKHTHELFSGKRVVLFALPGAFTLTCSLLHLPGYEELYEEFKASGVDELYCLSVNDGFVMNAWAEKQEIKKVKMLPDALAKWTKSLNLEVESAELGLRSKRYALIIDDKEIVESFIEEDNKNLGISSAKKVLQYLNPSIILPSNVVIFTFPECIHCFRAKEMLKTHGIKYSEQVFNKDFDFNTLKALGGGKIPQIFIDGEHLGGESELKKWLEGENEAPVKESP